MRGVEFKVIDRNRITPMENGDDDVAAGEALNDIVRWLGFRSVDDYLYALPLLRERVFEGAKYGEAA